MDRLQAIVYATILVLITGWVLYIGKEIFVPVLFGAVVVYVVVGLASALQRVPYLGRSLPIQLRYAISMLMLSLAFFTASYLVIANKDNVFALAPQYQESLLAVIQKIAVVLRIEAEPSWAMLRRELFAQINIQRLLGSMVVSVSSVAVSIVIVLLYAVFLLLEQHSFPEKVSRLSSDPRVVTRIRQVTSDINSRIGAYLMLKTLLSVLLGAVSWVVMFFMGLEFAAFWAVLIALLNYIPYIGSFLGVLFPVVMAVVQFEDQTMILSLLFALSIAQFLIGNFLDPYVMGKSLNLSPFAILVSLAIWSELWGIPGAFLAVPITAIVAIVLSEFAHTRPIAVLLSKSGRL